MAYLDDFESYPPSSVSLFSPVWLFSAISHLGLQAEKKCLILLLTLGSVEYLWQRCICPSLKIFFKTIVLFVTPILWFWSIAELLILICVAVKWAEIVFCFLPWWPADPCPGRCPSRRSCLRPGETCPGPGSRQRRRTSGCSSSGCCRRSRLV